MLNVIHEPDARPVKIWASELEDEALAQAKNLARLPFIAGNGVALMPDAHAGKGSTVGSVIATHDAIIPAAVGVDIGCGMNAVRLTLKAKDLPDSLACIRGQIERDIPMGAGGANHEREWDRLCAHLPTMPRGLVDHWSYITGSDNTKKASLQLGTLGSGNHFIELCVDENEDVWVMLHSGSRGVGNKIGTYFIERAREHMRRYFINLPDRDLAYLPAETQDFDDYRDSVLWAQDYALENRQMMMARVLHALQRHIPTPFAISSEAINCHHNYVARESHFGQNLWITRKGAIRSREGDLGIIPGSMGQRSYIVRGKGNPESYCSCSHGAGRRMSRTAARKHYTVADLRAQTEGVECRKDEAVLDEIPGAYKDIDVVMANQRDLIEVVHTLKAVLCVKGG